MVASDPNYMRDYMRARRKARREKFIQLLGGKCVMCGSKENLEFDHLKPKKKEFDISNAKDAPEKIILKEVNKCQLLCRPCHMKKTRDKWEFGSKPAKHGSLWRYKRYKCRCKKCKKAMSDYLKKKRSLLKVVRTASMIEYSLKLANAINVIDEVEDIL